ncbi:MAG: MerR family transcriptional regulator [Anaerolineae bacterium]
MPLSQTPIYNLKAVLKETGIAADTLRAWERRYGVPMPQRTPGGHRLYSQHDIHLIKWLVARQAEGLSISRAVKQWNSLTATGEDPLATGSGELSPRVVPQANLDTLRAAWLSACLEFHESEAEQVLNQAFAIYTVETVVTEILLRGLRDMGDRWQESEVTVQQEHFVSALAMRRFDALIAASPRPVRPASTVLACPAGESHSLPLVYLNLLLRRRGWQVVLLGADVPLEHLEETTRAVKASLVVLAAQRLTTVPALRDAASALVKSGISVAYGGGVFNRLPELRGHIPAEFLGEAVETSTDRIEEILGGSPSTTPSIRHRPRTEAQAFRAARTAIEGAVQQQLGDRVEPGADLAIANSYFGSALAAALELGDVAYVRADLAWIRSLLMKPHLPFKSEQDYLLAYAAGIRRAMGGSSQIATWLERYSNSDRSSAIGASDV